MSAVSLFVLAALDLGALFSQKEAWSEKAEFFLVDHAKDGFSFADEDRKAVTCLRHDTCTWHGLKVWEARVYFDKGAEAERVERVELSLYNRGDAGIATMDETELKAAVSRVADRFGAAAKGVKPEKRSVGQGVTQYLCRFDRGDPTGELVWGLSAPGADSRRGVEYLRLTLAPAGSAKPKRTVGAKRIEGRAGQRKIVANVTKSPKGDVYVDNVPMVDQGQKGYCAAAVAERVLRYYGNRIDEHEIAAVAGTTADGGTSVDAMREVVRTVGAKQGLGYQNIVSMTAGIGDLEDEIARYNKAAKAERKPTLSLDRFTRGRTVYVSEMRAAMDKKVVYRMRQKDARLKKFSAGIRQQVNAGIPVFWGVTLGIYPERGLNPQSTGGHMRLIIGYNDKKREILYTDTWGEGHELKRMPEDWAFAITHDAFFLKPR